MGEVSVIHDVQLLPTTCNDAEFLQTRRVYDAHNHNSNHSSPASENPEPRSGAMFVAK
jgi:hypothetical protein